MLHLLVRQLAEAKGHDAQVGGVERFHAWDVGERHRVDGAVKGVYWEQDRAFEPVPHGQDFGQHRQTFLRAVLLISGEEDDMFTPPGSVLAFVDDEVGSTRPTRKSELQEEDPRGEISYEPHIS